MSVLARYGQMAFIVKVERDETGLSRWISPLRYGAHQIGPRADAKVFLDRAHADEAIAMLADACNGNLRFTVEAVG
jgi:hypothetical protein